ncbi:MAG: 3-octaprenyl-4-hydroxybenzoate carboxy-lyase [Bradyrhizobiaceae bacterium]|nr:MAG: 3-octaprenyl-4-hydroxybenzoate carboxy-lyase [Bradyrhizobiaceae bacterium]
MSAPARVVVGLSGASGAAIGLRVVELLAREVGAEVHLVVTRAAERTVAHEAGASALARIEALARRHAIDDVGAPIASGSFRTAGMIVAPCSMHTLSAIATSHAENLLLRAADVQLKERRPLVLVARETPLHLGHIRLMAAATEIGAIVAPPVPAFYLRPRTVEEIVDQMARRVVDLLALTPAPLARPWTGEPGA